MRARRKQLPACVRTVATTRTKGLIIGDMTPAEETMTIPPATTATNSNDSAAAFVTKFANHHQKCVALAKQFTNRPTHVKDSAAIAQLCRASQEMLDQAKAARALTEIYLALDDEHRDTVRPIITDRFKDIARSAKASWLRFCDSVQLARDTNPEIATAQREFQPHADQFQQALREFIAMSTGAE